MQVFKINTKIHTYMQIIIETLILVEYPKHVTNMGMFKHKRIVTKKVRISQQFNLK